MRAHYSSAAKSPFGTSLLIESRAGAHIAGSEQPGIRGLGAALAHEEYVMVYRPGFMKMIFGVAIVAATLASASVGASAQPQLLGHGGFQSAGNELVDGWRNDGPANPTIEPDPTDDGNIVVECVAFTGSLGGGAFALNASVPHRGLGPSKCPPFEFRHIQ